MKHLTILAAALTTLVAGSAGAHPSSGNCVTTDMYHEGPSFGYVKTLVDVENHCPHRINFQWKVRRNGALKRTWASRGIRANGSTTIEIGFDDSGNVPAYGIVYCDEYPTHELRRVHSVGRCER